MPPPHHLPPLTLIVATTPTLGIGLRGTLPWPPLKPDLAFFARVTKRVLPAPITSSSSSSSSSSGPTASRDLPRAAATAKDAGSGNRMNALVMGRRTWESIPRRLRPLAGRVNVVVSRTAARAGGERGSELDGEGTGVLKWVGGLGEALAWLQAHSSSSSSSTPIPPSSPPPPPPEPPGGPNDSFTLARTFIIGGAQLYAAALALPNCERVLWTRVEREFVCDTWFPRGVLPLDGEVGRDMEGEGKGEGEGGGRWVRRSREAMEEWVGEEGCGGRREEGGLGFEISMVERVG